MDLVKAVLKESGLKATAARIALMDFLMREHGPFSIEEIADQIDHDCNATTLYRNVSMLFNARIIEVFELGDGVRRYEYNPHKGKNHHHHVICEVCKMVVKTEVCLPPNWQKKLEKLRFKNIRHRLNFYGICHVCAA